MDTLHGTLGAQVGLVGDGLSLVLALTLGVNHDRVIIHKSRVLLVLLKDLPDILVPIRVELVERILCDG